MAETTMPAAEAAVAVADERNSYEFAFHVLPTVAEGEVASVFELLKTHITKDGGEIFDSEAPERFDLAYDIVKHIEGKNRKFSSAYFGWIRFKADASITEQLTEEIEGTSEILRYLLIKLTKAEEAQPFRFHEALSSEKMITNVDEVLQESKAEAQKSEKVEETEKSEETEAESEAEVEAVKTEDAEAETESSEEKKDEA